MKSSTADKKKAMGVYITPGIAIGAVIGALTDKVGFWLDVGVAVGAGVEMSIGRLMRGS